MEITYADSLPQAGEHARLGVLPRHQLHDVVVHVEHNPHRHLRRLVPEERLQTVDINFGDLEYFDG